jgi:hypothetical protein
VKLPNAKDKQAPFFFQGTYQPSKRDAKGEDCIAIFDPTTGAFRLESISGTVNIM